MDTRIDQKLSLDEIKERLEALPTLPAIVMALSTLDPMSPDFPRKIRDLVSQEPAMCTRVLQRVNSARFAPVQDVVSVREGLTRLGADEVAKLLTSLSVVQVFVPYTESQKNLWRHALQCAIAARAIANASCLPVPPEEAATCGLLHDLGRFVMLQFDPKDLSRIEESGWNDVHNLVATERDICGFDHAHLGTIAAKHWGLPQKIIDVIAWHHTYDTIDAPQSVVQLTRVIQVADSLSVCLMNGKCDQGLSPDCLAEYLEKSCNNPDWHNRPLSGAKLATLVDKVKHESEEQFKTLGL